MSDKPEEKDIDEDVSLDDEDAEQISGGVSASVETHRKFLKEKKPGEDHFHH